MCSRARLMEWVFHVKNYNERNEQRTNTYENVCVLRSMPYSCTSPPHQIRAQRHKSRRSKCEWQTCRDDTVADVDNIFDEMRKLGVSSYWNGNAAGTGFSFFCSHSPLKMSIWNPLRLILHSLPIIAHFIFAFFPPETCMRRFGCVAFMWMQNAQLPSDTEICNFLSFSARFYQFKSYLCLIPDTPLFAIRTSIVGKNASRANNFESPFHPLNRVPANASFLECHCRSVFWFAINRRNSRRRRRQHGPHFWIVNCATNAIAGCIELANAIPNPNTHLLNAKMCYEFDCGPAAPEEREKLINVRFRGIASTRSSAMPSPHTLANLHATNGVAAPTTTESECQSRAEKAESGERERVRAFIQSHPLSRQMLELKCYAFLPPLFSATLLGSPCVPIETYLSILSAQIQLHIYCYGFSLKIFKFL